MTSRKYKVLRPTAFLTLLIGLVILGYFWKVLGERGLHADATGTAGYMTGSEVALIIVGMLFIVFSVVLMIILRPKSH